MQQPGTVSFRFISKMRLVSGPWLGRGVGWGVGWLPGRCGVSLWDAFAVPVPPFPRAGRDSGVPSAHAVSSLSLWGSISSQNDSVCYVKAAFPLLGTILNRTTFKENSTNANKMKTVRRMYESIDENVDPCIREEDDEEHALSEMCFEEFTTSPYEMLVLVRQFFQDIKQLLQNKETFEKDCSQVYRSACAGPQQHSSSPGDVSVLSAPGCALSPPHRGDVTRGRLLPAMLHRG
uniref:Uncharacterized protein n=1 Tax=Meleagris gallopavo TaxID=9103 RepID=A0A803YAD2_MELGA